MQGKHTKGKPKSKAKEIQEQEQKEEVLKSHGKQSKITWKLRNKKEQP